MASAMTAQEFVRHACRAGGWSLARLASAVGIARSSMNSVVNRDRDIKIGKLSEMAGILGWELVVVPKGTRLPNGSIRLIGPEEAAKRPVATVRTEGDRPLRVDFPDGAVTLMVPSEPVTGGARIPYAMGVASALASSRTSRERAGAIMARVDREAVSPQLGRQTLDAVLDAAYDAPEGAR